MMRTTLPVSSDRTFVYTSRPSVFVLVLLRGLTFQTGWCSSLEIKSLELMRDRTD